MAKDKFVVILTEYYPYGAGEVFLETEMEYLSKFVKVLIFPWYITHRGMARKMPSNCTAVSRRTGNSAAEAGVMRALLVREAAELLGQRRLNGRTVGMMLEWYQRACIQAEFVLKELSRRKIAKTEPIVCYSYWMNTGALALIMIKQVYRNARLVTRCHGFDLYEEREAIRYLPFRQELFRQLDDICPISYDGKRYLMTHYRTDYQKIKVHRLGTTEREILFAEQEVLDRRILRVVSCSRVIAVKRVYRIVQALQTISDIRIEWTHWGGGVQLEQIKKMCRDKLGSNISIHLEGAVSNETVLRSYERKAYHVFVNTSESEGIPVSIMEAMSFGIPVIAPDVGGISEIVRHKKNGYLLKPNFRDEEVAEYIRAIADMSDEEYGKMRKWTRHFWKKYYSAEKNYPEFVNDILCTEREEK